MKSVSKTKAELATEITQLKTKLEDAERKQRVLVESFRNTSKSISHARPLAMIFDDMFREIYQLTPCDGISILIVEPDPAKLFVYPQYNNPLFTQKKSDKLHLLTMMEYPLLDRIQADGCSLVIPNTTEAVEWNVTSDWLWIKSFAGIPLIYQGKTLGFLLVASKMANSINRGDDSYLEAFASLTACAIENARLFQNLTQILHQEDVLKTITKRLKLLSLTLSDQIS